MRRACFAALLASIVCAAGPALAQPVTVPAFSQAQVGSAPPPGWSALTFRRIDKHTRYAIVVDDGQPVVAAQADASASGWIHRLDVPIERARILRWRWKAQRLPAAGDTRTKAGDDAAARLYVTFRYAPERLSFFQRALYETTRAIYGEAPPHASLMYVWDSKAPAGTSVVNPYTDRVRTIVVEGGPARVGQWLDYERDLLADYRAAFNEEPPPLSGIAIMTDTDNTGGTAAASYGDVTLQPR